MAFTYEDAVPWGRSFNEYRRIFQLTDGDLHQSILGCADGPANFNAEMFRKGHRVISCDPLYRFTAEQIKRRIDTTYEEVIGQTRQNQEKFVWDVITSPDELGRLRLEAMGDFLNDYEQGRRDGRYILAKLPDLPFASGSFNFALCSHFLFFYANHFSRVFHQQAVDELCRVAHEVRIFPMVTYNAEPCPFINSIIEHLQEARRTVSIEKVPYQFQRGGNMMMRISGGNGR
jgi:hypothetical protein